MCYVMVISEQLQKCFILVLGMVLGVSISNVMHTANVRTRLSTFIVQEAKAQSLRAPKPRSDHVGSKIRPANHTIGSKPRIYCWVSTYPANHNTKATAVRNTWGQRCDNILFVSNEDGMIFPKLPLPSDSTLYSFADPSLPALNLTANSNYNGLWAKTKAAFRLIHDVHL